MEWKFRSLPDGKIAFDFDPYLHWLIYPQVGGVGEGNWEFPVVLEKPDGTLELMSFGSAKKRPAGGTCRGAPIANTSWPEKSKPPRIPNDMKRSLPTAILAIIDVDIAFAHAQFRRKDDRGRTRIAWFWDQGADCDPNSEKRPPIGQEMFAPDIEGLLDTPGDEAALYAKYWASTRKHRRQLPGSLAHGTHVLDTASWDLPAEVAIFAVELPALIVKGTHGAFLFPYVQLAIERIVEVAKAWAAGGTPPPIVLNFSFGSYAGRHDGQSRFERYLDKKIEDDEICAICIAAGNNYDTQTHARLTGEGKVDWRIQPGDGTPSFLQIWLPREVPSGFDLGLTVKPPAGEPLKLDKLSPGFHELAAGDQVLARAYVETDKDLVETDPRTKRPPRTCVTLAVRHTDAFVGVLGYQNGRPELAGDWTLTLERKGLEADETLMIWVERDDVVPGTRTGARQSYLRASPPRTEPPQREDERGNRNDAETVRYDGAINDFGTGKKTTVVAGHRRSDGTRARYSSVGFKLKEKEVSVPIISAACEESPAHRGVLAAGWSSGSIRAMGGTSAATAVVSREIVRLLIGAGAAKSSGSPQVQVFVDESPVGPNGVRAANGKLNVVPPRYPRIEGGGNIPPGTPEDPTTRGAGEALKDFLKRIGRPIGAVAPKAGFQIEP